MLQERFATVFTYFVCKESHVKRMLPGARELGFQFEKINITNVHNKG